MKSLKYIFLLLSIIWLLGSCKMGKNYSKPELDIPNAFINSSDTSFNADLKWWNLFNDPVLDTLITTALKNNYDVLATAQRVEAAMHQLNIQKAELLPKFGYQGQAQRGNFNLIQTEQVSNNFNDQVNYNCEGNNQVITSKFEYFHLPYKIC